MTMIIHKLRPLAALLALLLPSSGHSQQVLLRKTDVVVIQISGVPAEERQQIERAYTINDKGQIRLPYIQPLAAAGMAVDALAEKIEAVYKQEEIFTRPRVTVSTREEARITRRVVVMGEVNRPGAVPYQPEMTILEAIATSGNATAYGNMKKVRLMRKGKTYQIDLSNVTSNQERDIPLLPGDRIIVPE